MCAILPDKYQWLAPGFRLLLTGSHCLSGFTQMETILSQHSHKNQSGLFSFLSLSLSSFFFSSSLPLHCGETAVGLFSFYWSGDNTFICLQDLLRAPRLRISQRSVTSRRREWARDRQPRCICWDYYLLESGFHFLPFRASDSDDVERPDSSCGYWQLLAFWSMLWAHSVSLLVRFRMSFLIITLSSVSLPLGASPHYQYMVYI